MPPFIETKPSAHILVVDDIADNRELLVRRLLRYGYTCAEAKDGFEALDLMKKQVFDLILLDVSMPRMGGIELLTRMRSHFFQTQLPIIMVTADAQAESIAHAKKLGANDYITKPVNFSLALACIELNLLHSRASTRISEARRELQLARQALA